MKLSTKFSLGYILQIFAVLLLFGSPGGCSSITGQKEFKVAEKTMIHENMLYQNENMNNNPGRNDSMILFKPELEEIKYSFFTTPVNNSINIKKKQVIDT